MKTFERCDDGSIRVFCPPYFNIVFEGVMYTPQSCDNEFRAHYEAVKDTAAASVEGLWSMYTMARQCLSIGGDYFECGVHAGGTALFLARLLEGSVKKLHLFDTFCGMPETDPLRDAHLEGQFADAPIEKVRSFVGHEESVSFHKGMIPATFTGLEDVEIAFAYIDVDIYRSTMDCLEFIYPRLKKGGILLLDDYSRPTCPGAREAVDEFFMDKKEVPLTIIACQALVFKI